MNKLDIDLKKLKPITGKVIHTVYFGGERIRKVQIWYNSQGEANTARIIYSEPKKKKI